MSQVNFFLLSLFYINGANTMNKNTLRVGDMDKLYHVFFPLIFKTRLTKVLVFILNRIHMQIDRKKIP